MRVLFDTNVILDVLLEREPHIDVASKLVALVDNGRIEGSVCATTVTTLYYIGAKDLGRKAAHEKCGRCSASSRSRRWIATSCNARSRTRDSATSRTRCIHEAAHLPKA